LILSNNFSPTDAQENCFKRSIKIYINPLNDELNPICHLLALLGAHHILYVSGVRVKQLQHVSVQTPSSGSALFELAELTVVKIVN